MMLLVTGCAYPQTEIPEPFESNPIEHDGSDITVDVPEDKNEDSEEIPIYLEEIPIILTIRQPDSIGNVYLDATYMNKSKYPIKRYSMTILLKNENEKTYLITHDTVLPGEISPKFDSLGPQTKEINDIEKLKLEITALTENNKELYIEYDYKLGIAEWYYSE